MNFLTVLDLVIFLLGGLLGAANQAGSVAAVEAIRAAIAKLQEVKDTPVTKEQVESLRITPLW